MNTNTIGDDRDLRLGRARVAGNDALRRYYGELDRLDAGALWTVANDIEPWEPRPLSVPTLWRWSDLRPQALRSVDLVDPDDAGRRVVYLRNPERRDVSAVCGLLFSGIQVMRPGERASAHRHGASALRLPSKPTGTRCTLTGTRGWTIR